MVVGSVVNRCGAVAGAGLAIMAGGLPVSGQQWPSGLAKAGTTRTSDVVRLADPGWVQLRGLMGARYAASAGKRLPVVDEDELLGGYRHKPGKHPWIGEHVGKWLHAASLTYACTRDASLRAKLDRVAKGLLAAQEPDGYLGTYVPAQRFGLYPDADWDVWSHKYCLIGLLSYYQYTGDASALAGARRAGDLLLATFGPGKKLLNSAGTHLGMAATSVLEPMVLLYRATADPRYLDFAKWIVTQWDAPGGPGILKTLTTDGTVRKTANAKAYEMLSNLAGLCELYRATGTTKYLEAVMAAWRDIVSKRLYITGSGSAGECWQDDYVLPNGEGSNICETCVTVSWIQLNLHLLRIKGEARFADQIEKSVLNHLFAAQKPSGDMWCYYTPLQGRKPYGNETNCCLSSGPRGIALLPVAAYGVRAEGVVVNLLTDSRAALTLASGRKVEVSQATRYPYEGHVAIAVAPARNGDTFSLYVRLPGWCAKPVVKVNGKVAPLQRPGTYAVLRRAWSHDLVTLDLPMAPRLVEGTHTNAGSAAVTYGPLVLAADIQHNPWARPLSRAAVASGADRALVVSTASAPEHRSVEVDVAVRVASGGAVSDKVLKLVPFADAGTDGKPMQVWLRTSLDRRAGGSVFAFGDESRSRQGNQGGSICDEEAGTFAVTFDTTKQDEDWYEVAAGQPVAFDRVVFRHGRSFHDGGWFDTSAGKPRLQVRKTADGPWEDLATLDSYPATTADVAPAGLADGQAFDVSVPKTTAVAIRIVGKPACGDNPSQAFSSCAELAAYLAR